MLLGLSHKDTLKQNWQRSDGGQNADPWKWTKKELFYMAMSLPDNTAATGGTTKDGLVHVVHQC